MTAHHHRNGAVLPPTINIHLIRSCNYACRFCYAGFRETGPAFIARPQLISILEAVSKAARGWEIKGRKVNFAGGEPFLYPQFTQVIDHAKKLGLTTSVVTNGSRLTEQVVAELAGRLDILAVSVDSLSPDVNRAIGRCDSGAPPGWEHYSTIAGRVLRAGIRLKINTVVNRHNIGEDMGHEVSGLSPFRWKIFQAKHIGGQNDAQFGHVAVSDPEFTAYVKRNRRSVSSSVLVVPETADAMKASYAMIAPNGCFFDNSQGFHRYSRPIVEVGLLEAFSEVEFSEERFINRGGVYA